MAPRNVRAKSRQLGCGVCQLCAYYIESHETLLDKFGHIPPAQLQWLGEFRALVQDDDDHAITGIGTALEQDYTFAHAPPEFTARFDDGSYHKSYESGFMTSMLAPQDFSKRGFQFHDSCWRLFSACVNRSADIILDSKTLGILFDLGLSVCDRVGHKWHALSDDLCEEKLSEKGLAEPFALQAVKDIVSGALESKDLVHPEARQIRISPKIATKGPGNIFQTMPSELLAMIALMLDTSSVLNMAIATGICPLLSQPFWKSRFDPHMEFGHIFEIDALRGKQGLNWSQLYTSIYKVSYTVAPAQVENRKRIWGISQSILKVFRTHGIRTPNGNVVSQPRLRNLLEVNGASRYYRSLSIPCLVHSLRVCVVKFDHKEYLSGFSINKEKDLAIGFFDARTSREVVQGSPLNNFVVVADENGFLKFHRDTPERLPDGVAYGVIRLGSTLVACFDSIKFVAMGARADSDPALLWHSKLPQSLEVRPEDMFLTRSVNNLSYTYYNPFHVHLFHDPVKGFRRESLIRIDAYMLRFSRLIGMEFSYLDGTSLLLGQRKSPIFSNASHRAISFVIDGPGSEFITELRTGDSGAPSGTVLTVSTNRGRQCRFADFDAQIQDKVETFGPRKGCLIAGFIFAYGVCSADQNARVFRSIGIVRNVTIATA